VARLYPEKDEKEALPNDICNSTSTPNYCDEPYCDLGMYVNKVLSAWTEVSMTT